MYKRVLIKISGEAFEGKKGYGIDYDFVTKVAEEIKEVKDKGIDVGIVLGAGNICRGQEHVPFGVPRIKADYMGMTATIINGIALESMLEKIGCEAVVMSPLYIQQLTEQMNQEQGQRHLKKGRIVICVGGTGNPFFTTDSAGVLRALEFNCDVLIKATKVDGLYDKDPKKYDDAKKITSATYSEVLEKEYRVMDLAAVALARDSNLEIKIISLFKEGSIMDVCMGGDIGTSIKD